MNKNIQIFFLLSALVLLILCIIDIRSDYYYYFTKKETIGVIKQIEKVNKNEPYIVSLNYFNEYTNLQSECSLNINGRFGKKINDSDIKFISIAYTKKTDCDFYIIDYKHPNIGGFTIHILLFLTTLLGVILFTKNLISPSSSSVR